MCAHITQLLKPIKDSRFTQQVSGGCGVWVCAVLCDVIGEPIKPLAQLIGEPIKLRGKPALRKALGVWVADHVWRGLMWPQQCPSE